MAGVEREAPGVAQPVGPDLGPGALAAHERVVGRDPVGPAPARPRVDPEDLAEQGVQRLAVAEGVAAAAAVAEGDVEAAVGPEGELAAVVVAERVVEVEDRALRAGVGPLATHGQLGDLVVAVPVAVGQVQVAAVGREGQPQQPLLPAGGDLPGDVDHRGRVELAAADRPHPPHLLDQVQRAVPGPHRHGHRLLQLGHRDQPDLGRPELGTGRRLRLLRGRGRPGGGRHQRGRAHTGRRSGRPVGLTPGTGGDQQNNAKEGGQAASDSMHARHSRRPGQSLLARAARVSGGGWGGRRPCGSGGAGPGGRWRRGCSGPRWRPCRWGRRCTSPRCGDPR